MTRINRLVCNGFKSFAKHTELIFGEQFNCIIGPNGSGKSNVLDALCFVLGKSSSKSLRAEKASNLIYNGGKLKNPAKQGEVSIYFDNSTHVFPTTDSEVKISRIVKQSGQSVYKINDKTVTRQQILDLLSLAKIDPDGYNIILQGDIVAFVEMPPLERRVLIEDIAGIGIYEEKKHKALLELNKVDERLKEAEIILAERSNYLKELKDERNQALKYKEALDEIKVNKASYIKIQMNTKQGHHDVLQGKIKEQEAKLHKHQGKAGELRASIEEHKKAIEAITKEIEEKGEVEQVRLNKTVESLKVELAQKQTKMESLHEEILKVEKRKEELRMHGEDIKIKIAQLREQVKDKDEVKRGIERDQKDIGQKIKAFRKKHKLEDIGTLETDMEKIDADIEDAEQEVQKLRESQQQLFREKDRIELYINSADEKIKKVEQIAHEHKKQMDELKEKRDAFKTVTLELNTALNKDSELAGRIADLRQKLVKVQEEVAKLTVKTMHARESASMDLAIKKILEGQHGIPGVFGTVSDLGTVPTKYALALEVAAGIRLKSIIVDNDKTAAACIKYLKSQKLGTATFIPLNTIKPPKDHDSFGELKKAKGVLGEALDFIDYDSRYRKAFEYVFKNTLVIEHIDVARRLGVGTVKMVTLDGDLSELSGVMQGGFRKRNIGTGFKEKDVKGALEGYEAMETELSQDIEALGVQRSENEATINLLRARKAELEGEIIKTEKSLHLESGDLEITRKEKEDLHNKLKSLERELQQVSQQIAEKNTLLAQHKSKKQALKSKISEIRNPRVLAEINTFEERKQELSQQLLQALSDMNMLHNQLTSVYEPELEKTASVITQHEREIAEFKEQIKLWKSEIQEKTTLLNAKEKEAEKFFVQFKSLFHKRTKINEEITQIEQTLGKQQDQARDVELAMNTLQLELARLSAERAGLQQEFEPYQNIQLDLAKSEEEYKKAISKYERILADMGSVNMRALEIYDQVDREYHNLLDKKSTLETEKTDVLKLMQEIDEKKSELFLQTFDVVNKNFERIFNDLAAKGAAYLELEDPEHPFESGVSIKVKLSTNKFLDIKSLSGGEKTLTALAFIFCIQEYEPASFYVLDEVDAALDKRNSEKLAKLIRKYSEKAQYVIISHNDGMVAEADNLYGVNMNEHGVSMVVSLRI